MRSAPRDGYRPPRRDVTETGLRRVLIVTGVMAATLMQTLDSTITNVALPTIQGNLGASLDEGTWVVTAYTIAAIVVIPLTPWLQNRFGRKNYFLASIVGFTLASVACGASTVFPMLVISRVVQGAFGGGLLATAQSILRDTFPPEKLGISQGVFAFGAIIGPTLGPPVGGILVDNAILDANRLFDAAGLLQCGDAVRFPLENAFFAGYGRVTQRQRKGKGMKTKTHLIFIARVLAMTLFQGLRSRIASISAAEGQLSTADGPFQPDDASLKQYRCPDWFRDAKFGIWAVWGPQSVLEQGDWYARNMYVQAHPQYIHHLQTFGHPSQHGYKDIIPLWKAENWHPDRLMTLYKQAGAKYSSPLRITTTILIAGTRNTTNGIPSTTARSEISSVNGRRPRSNRGCGSASPSTMLAATVGSKPTRGRTKTAHLRTCHTTATTQNTKAFTMPRAKTILSPRGIRPRVGGKSGWRTQGPDRYLPARPHVFRWGDSLLRRR